MQRQDKAKVTEIAEQIRKEGGFDANAFWKHAEKIRGKKSETGTAMKDEDGKIQEDPEKVKEIHKRYFEKLLKDREPEGQEEKELEDLKEKCIRAMEKAASRFEKSETRRS